MIGAGGVCLPQSTCGGHGLTVRNHFFPSTVGHKDQNQTEQHLTGPSG